MLLICYNWPASTLRCASISDGHWWMHSYVRIARMSIASIFGLWRIVGARKCRLQAGYSYLGVIRTTVAVTSFFKETAYILVGLIITRISHILSKWIYISWLWLLASYFSSYKTLYTVCFYIFDIFSGSLFIVIMTKKRKIMHQNVQEERIFNN